MNTYTIMNYIVKNDDLEEIINTGLKFAKEANRKEILDEMKIYHENFNEILREILDEYMFEAANIAKHLNYFMKKEYVKVEKVDVTFGLSEETALELIETYSDLRLYQEINKYIDLVERLKEARKKIENVLKQTLYTKQSIKRIHKTFSDLDIYVTDAQIKAYIDKYIRDHDFITLVDSDFIY